MSANLGLPYLASGQAQKHVTLNETISRLDALVQLSVVSATVTVEPTSPTDGATYILPTARSGAHWTAFADASLAYYRDGAWEQITPREGWIAYIKDSDQLQVYTGSAWSQATLRTALGAAGTGIANTFSAKQTVTVNSGVHELAQFNNSTAAALARFVGSGGGSADCGASTNADEFIVRTGGTIRLQVGTATFAYNGQIVYHAGNVGAAGASLIGYTPVSKAGDTMSGALTTPAVFANGVTPLIALTDTASGTNMKASAWLAGGNQLSGVLSDDGFSASTSWVTVSRSGRTPTDINFNAGLTIGAPSGGNKGAGTLNATAVYDDNTLLTDLVLDLAVDGAFNPKAYAGHPIAAEAAAWWFDLDAYAAFWRRERRLPGMRSWDAPVDAPSTGESVTRLTAVVEVQAVLIEQLNNRLKAMARETRQAEGRTRRAIDR